MLFHDRRLGIFTAICAPWALYAYGGRPISGHSGVPGERTCAVSGCHAGTLNSGEGRITLTLSGAPNTYTPGVRRQITVRVNDPNAVTYGFQLTVRSAADPRLQAGSLHAGDGSAVLCSAAPFLEDRDKPPAGCPATLPLESASHTGPRASGVWTLSWDPPASAMGDVVIYAAGNGADGNGRANGGDRIYTAQACLGPAAPASTSPSIAPCGVITAAAFGGATAIAPGSFFEIYGERLASETREWAASTAGEPLPTRLSDVEVMLGDQAAPLRFVSPTQISGLVPPGALPGPVNLAVVRGGERSAEAPIRLLERAPALFQTPLHADGLPVTAERPVRAGDVILLYGTGFGSLPLPPLTVRIAATEGQVDYAGPAPGFVGLYQFNIVVPSGVAGTVPVRVSLGGIDLPRTLALSISGG